MGEMDIGNADYGNLENTETKFSVDAVNTDAAEGLEETEWQNPNWSQYLGYYKEIPELAAAIDAKATWTVGKGFKADPETTFLLDNIKGFGKDTFNTILENAIRTYHIGGDAFLEIIRSPQTNFMVNLKPLDPGSIKIITNKAGIIIRYEQTHKTDSKKTINSWKPEEIFHLARNRVADEIHGESLIRAVEKIILMRNEAMDDMQKLMHRHVQPVIKYQLDTDDATKIAEFKVTADKANELGENLFIPMGAVEADIMSVAANSTLNPIPWIDRLNSYFWQVAGVPQIVVGGSQELTEATAKILYLAFEQTIEEEQLYIEEQCGLQLGLTIELDFPATLQNELLSSQKKGETMQASTPEDTAVTGGQV